MRLSVLTPLALRLIQQGREGLMFVLVIMARSSH